MIEVEDLNWKPECAECHDIGEWVDEATELCEMCFEHIFGPGSLESLDCAGMRSALDDADDADLESYLGDR